MERKIRIWYNNRKMQIKPFIPTTPLREEAAASYPATGLWQPEKKPAQQYASQIYCNGVLRLWYNNPAEWTDYAGPERYTGKSRAAVQAAFSSLLPHRLLRSRKKRTGTGRLLGYLQAAKGFGGYFRQLSTQNIGDEPMSYQLKRLPIGQGVYFSSVSDPKFKHNRISVNFITPLDEATVSDNAIVPFLLRKGCKSCPDFTALEQKLCQLYGASLDADVAKFGQYQILSVSIQSIDDRFALNKETLSRDCAELLADIAFDPKITAGSFDETDLNLEKSFLMDTIAAEINEKRSYALGKCKEHMCKGEASAIRKYGSIEAAQKITAKSAGSAYRRLADTAAIEILFVGSGSPDDALAIFSGLFDGLKRTETQYTTCPRKAVAEKVREYTEEMEISQSKLVMGFRTGEPQPYAKLGGMRMMAALFGGTPFSRLFVNVREKLSLCYYCAARFDLASGILMVDSGVEAQNKQRTQEEVLAQLEVLKRGDFTDQELESTRLAIVNSLRSTGDSLGGIESWYLTQILMGSSASPAQEVEMMSKITKEQVVAAANQVTLDTVYFLTSKGGATL